MPGSMSPIDRALWNVAEAASRYSDSMADSQRRKAWGDIEGAVAAARALWVRSGAAAGSPATSAQVSAVQRTAEILRQRAEKADRRVAEALAASREIEAQRDAALAAATGAAADASRAADARDALRVGLAAAEAQRDEALRALDRASAAPVASLVPPAPTTQPAKTWARPGADVGLTVEHTGLLAVRATMGNLLPDSLGEHLIPGARVLRQDSRLAALVAVPCGADGSMSEEAIEQAGRLVAQGFRVDWVAEDELVA